MTLGTLLEKHGIKKQEKYVIENTQTLGPEYHTGYQRRT